MITIYEKNNASLLNGSEKELELRGLSTDTKPTTIGGKTISNGTSFIEIDTAKLYIFDKENEEWNEV